MTENQTETSERADLSWLADAQPVKTTMRTSRRGRQPSKNPVAGHVKAAYDSGEVLSLSVPKTATKTTERLLRRAAKDKSISVQVLSAHPDSATSEDVVALNALDPEHADYGSLPEDLWVSFSVSDKTEKQSANGESASETSDADPFAGAPSANAGDGDDSGTESESAPAARKGRRSGK